ncbi:MAG: hypothetical protein QM723_01350 [Myxococcaceae bacterium]
MQLFLLACRFLGSWLLVAGPVFQAALELQGLDFEWGRLRTKMRELAPPKVSPLWWLVPPVKLILERRYLRSARERLTATLSAEELEGMMEFTNKSTGWFFVAGGGLLLAINATWEVAEHFKLPSWLFVVLCVVFALLCALNTQARLWRTHADLEKKRGESASAS